MYTAGRRGQATLISLTMTDCHDQGPSFCTLPGNRDLPHRDAPLATPRLGRASLHSHRPRLASRQDRGQASLASPGPLLGFIRFWLRHC